MTLAVSPINDAEIQRQNKNSTDTQKKNNSQTKEGVVVNSLVKEPQNVSVSNMYDSLVISENTKMPSKLNESNPQTKNIMPIALISTGVMATIAMITAVVAKGSNANLTLASEKKLEHITRNICISDESQQGLYQMVQCPTKKTILAGSGAIAIGAMAFMGKMFIDGFKEIWVKQKEADIQKNLQENLVAVETQTFSGKIQITRSMLSQKAKEFNEYLCNGQNTEDCACFKGKLGFSSNKNNETNNDSNLKYFAIGALTLGSIVALGAISLKNLGKGKKHLDEYIKVTKNKISEIVTESDVKNHEKDKANLKNMFEALDSNPDYIKNELSKLKWEKEEKNGFIEEAIFNTKKSTTKADRAMAGDGTPKPAFNSFVNDYRAFFYNYLLDSDNPQFKLLFLSITGLSAISYGGKSLGEAVKEVQVKKMNAQTELDLQKRLVATELRNFKAKKEAAINPLCEEFYVQAEKGKPKEELKTMAENILFEVKNGPPFVYS